MKKNLIIGCMAVFAVSVQAQEGRKLQIADFNRTKKINIYYYICTSNST